MSELANERKKLYVYEITFYKWQYEELEDEVVGLASRHCCRCSLFHENTIIVKLIVKCA